MIKYLFAALLIAAPAFAAEIDWHLTEAQQQSLMQVFDAATKATGINGAAAILPLAISLQEAQKAAEAKPALKKK